MATEKRLRVSFDAEDEIVRRAIYIQAALNGESHNKLLNDLVRKHLPEAIELAKKAIEKDEPTPRQKKTPKPSDQ